jgi:phenylpropionate dioxygenase-like ring-hydroxylating dioxygenase large terminal subunit
MRQPLPPSAFSDPAIARAEDRAVFGRSWQWVATDADLPSPGDFTVVTVAGHQWVLRRGADGIVHGVRNVCLHRGSRLCSGSGHGPLRCPYHGWTYDDRGILIGIPFAEGLENDVQRGVDSLGAGQVASWGPALFFNPDPAAPSLRDTLGPLFAQLDPLFAAMDVVVDARSIDIDANWKIVMENALETSHVAIVHHDSIHPLGFEVTRTDFHSAHSVSHYSAPRAPRKLAAIAFAFPDRPIELDGYLHANVFPNSTVATAYGNFFVLTRTEPLAVDKTRLHWTMLSTRCAARSEAAAGAAALMNDSNQAFLQRTFEEDAGICARVHQGSAEATAHGFLGSQELRVAAFERELWSTIGTP